MNHYLLIVVLALITFFNRYLFIVRALPLSPGPEFKRFLRYSAYAILTAIWVPILFQFDIESGSTSFAGWDYLSGAVLAAILTLIRIPTLAVVIASTSLFFVLRFVLLPA